MIIYIDILILYNTLINAVNLYLSLNFNKVKIYKIKLFVVSFLVAIISFSFMLFTSPNVHNIIKILLPFLMCRVYFRNLSLKLLIKIWVTYLLFASILSGIMLFAKHTVILKNNKMISMIAVLLSYLLFVGTYKTIIKLFVQSAQQSKHFFEVLICHNNVSLSLIGFNDTGNSLTSVVDRLPVFISDEESLKPLISHNKIEYTYSECSTILEKSAIKTFCPDCIFVNGKRCFALIGIAQMPLDADFDILINFDNIKYNETEISYV